MTVTIGRRELLVALGAAAWPLAARAQQGEQMRRIGVLIAGLTENDSEGQLRMAAFRGGLTARPAFSRAPRGACAKRFEKRNRTLYL